MAIAYPIGLVGPIVSGYRNSDAIKTQINNVETGPPRIELITENGYAEFTAKWSFIQDEFQVFEGWFKHDIDFGKLAFDLLVKTGAGLKSHGMIFKKPYNAALSGKRWIVTASLISITKQYDTLADYNTAKAAL